MRIKLASVFALLLLANVALAQPKPGVPEVDRIRLAEAFRLGEALGTRIWRDWDKAPFAVLLITPEYEFLVRHPKPSPEFTLISYDSLLKSNVYFRKRTQQTNFLATFPAVGGVSTIVVGQAENTQAKTSTPWIVTLLHEHFHQWQDSQPDAFSDAAALNLSRGDQTGMWMLNYAFPYDTPEVDRQFSMLAKSLEDALQAKSRTDFSTKLRAYLAERQQLQKMLNPDDYRYFSFQLWKEGIARYTEYRIAELAVTKYKPSREFRSLKDFTSFESVAQAIRGRIISQLSMLRLESFKRVAFYPIGAGEGLLLDRANPEWHKRYFAEKFYLEKYFKATR